MQLPPTSIARLSFPADPRYLGVCRLATGALGQRAQLSDRGLADLRLAVSEVCALLIAGRRTGSERPIGLSLQLTALEVEVEVTDRHADAAVSAAPAAAALAELLAGACSRFSLGHGDGGFRATLAVARPA